MFYKLYKYLNIVLLFTYEHLKKTLQKVHLLEMRKTIEEHTPKGAKNTFGTLQNKNVPFGVFLHQNHKKLIS
ncbi:hypothetical protein COM69_18505 [Bacillus toyonensis]|nr:hypothetical protein COM69_18505 [Bacillus toyonensis]PHD40687.1 hypothetical protein COF65_17735 [Bacillus toyonensis]